MTVAEYNASIRMMWCDPNVRALLAELQTADDWGDLHGRLPVPMQYPEMEPNRRVFIGLNPSLSPGYAPLWDARETLLIDARYGEFQWVDTAIAIELAARGRTPDVDQYRYYSKLDHFAGEGNWESIDLFPIRITSQQILGTTLGFGDPYWNLKKRPDEVAFVEYFVDSLLEAFMGLLKGLEPSALVFCNKEAARLFFSQFSKRLFGTGCACGPEPWQTIVTLNQNPIHVYIISGGWGHAAGGGNRLRNLLHP